VLKTTKKALPILEKFSQKYDTTAHTKVSDKTWPQKSFEYHKNFYSDKIYQENI